jgi:hypothetical protein
MLDQLLFSIRMMKTVWIALVPESVPELLPEELPEELPDELPDDELPEELPEEDVEPLEELEDEEPDEELPESAPASLRGRWASRSMPGQAMRTLPSAPSRRWTSNRAGAR